MITNSNHLFVSYDELESLFNEALEIEIKEWKEEKERFFKDPFNKKQRNTGNYMPNAIFRLWLTIPKNLVTTETFNKLKNEIENAGWTIHDYRWRKDERTEEDQIFIHIEKK